MFANCNRPFSLGVIAGMLSVAICVPRTNGQTRINDRDLENLMRNLRDDAKSFQSTFNSAVGKTTIRKTSREKDAKNLVASFHKQTEAMLKNFKQHRKGDADVQNVRSSAQQIDQLVNGLKLGPQTTSKWDRIQTELQQISSAFGIASRNPRGISAGNIALLYLISVSASCPRTPTLSRGTHRVLPASRDVGPRVWICSIVENHDRDLSFAIARPSANYQTSEHSDRSASIVAT
jgi:hypothetical protein